MFQDAQIVDLTRSSAIQVWREFLVQPEGLINPNVGDSARKIHIISYGFFLCVQNCN